jgi:hypothetical protein
LSVTQWERSITYNFGEASLGPLESGLGYDDQMEADAEETEIIAGYERPLSSPHWSFLHWAEQYEGALARLEAGLADLEREEVH